MTELTERRVVGRYEAVVDGLTMSSSPIFEGDDPAHVTRRAEDMAAIYRDVNPRRAVVTVKFRAYTEDAAGLTHLTTVESAAAALGGDL